MTYTSAAGAPGLRPGEVRLSDGAIRLSDGGVVTNSDRGTDPAREDSSAQEEIQPFASIGPAGSCFVGASGVPRCEGALFATYPSGSQDEFGNPLTNTFSLELKTIVFPPKVRKMWVLSANVCVLAGVSELGLHCAGNNDNLQLGQGATDESTPFLPMHALTGFESGVTDAAMGFNYGCAVKAPTTTCWGTGVTPGAVTLPALAIRLAGGAEARCALTASGDVYCWGYSVVPKKNSADKFSNSAEPILVNTQGKVASISMSPEGQHVCALGVNGVVLCWGRNGEGQVAQPVTTRLVDLPAPVSTVSPGALSVGAGGAHSCAIKDNGGVFCWGSSAYGALGDNVVRTGAGSYVTTPVAVDQLGSGASALFVGDGASCALVGSGASRTFKCWGSNTLGKLQNGNALDQKVPVIVTVPN